MRRTTSVRRSHQACLLRLSMRASALLRLRRMLRSLPLEMILVTWSRAPESDQNAAPPRRCELAHVSSCLCCSSSLPWHALLAPGRRAAGGIAARRGPSHDGHGGGAVAGGAHRSAVGRRRHARACRGNHPRRLRSPRLPRGAPAGHRRRSAHRCDATSLPPPWLLSARCAAYCRGASSRHAVTELFEPQCRPGRAAGWSARRTAPHVTGGGQGRRASEMRVSPPAVLLCRGLLALLCCARYSRVRMWMYVCVCESDSCACPHASR